MDQAAIWAIYFAGVASLKFHPRNVMLPLENMTAEKSAIRNAAAIADLMLDEHNRRFKCLGS